MLYLKLACNSTDLFGVHLHKDITLALNILLHEAIMTVLHEDIMLCRLATVLQEDKMAI